MFEAGASDLAVSLRPLLIDTLAGADERALKALRRIRPGLWNPVHPERHPSPPTDRRHERSMLARFVLPCREPFTGVLNRVLE